MKNIYYFLVFLVSVFCFSTANAKTNNQLINETPTAKPIIYKVQNGDCLSKIARQYGLSTKELYDLNKNQIKNQNLIYKGQEFIVGYQALENQTTTTTSTTVIDSLSQPTALALELDSFDNLFLFSNSGKSCLIVDNLSLSFDSEIIKNLQAFLKNQKTINKPTEKIVNQDLSLLAKIKQVGIKYNTPENKLYSLREIVKSFKGKLIYCQDKNFELNETGEKLCLRKVDYNQLLWTCYGLDQTLYDCQDPVLIIVAQELGIKYNTLGQHLYTRQEIAESMINQDGSKKVVYSRSRRFQTAKGKVYLDCSAFAYFLGNCYGSKVPNKTTATIFTPKNGRRLIKSMDELRPGDLVGRPNDHVMTYLGNGLFVHSSGKLPLFVTKNKIKKSSGLYRCNPLPNQEYLVLAAQAK